MKKAGTLKEASNEALVAELQLRVPQLPDALRQQLSAALAEKTRPQVEGALSEKNAEKPTGILGVLERRLGRKPDHYRRPEGVDFAEVKSALEANPALMASLSKMEETGGAPDVIAIEGDTFIFADCSAESPDGRRDLNYDQTAQMADAFGVELMDEATYRKIQGVGKFDLNTWSWLKTPANIRKAGYALDGGRIGDGVGVDRYDARNLDAYRGWRGVLRVQKV